MSDLQQRGRPHPPSSGVVAVPGYSPDGRQDDELTLLIDVQPGINAGVPRITVFGEVDGPNAERLQKAVVDVLRHRQGPRIDVDLQGVTFLDSGGIRALLLCQAAARQMDRRIVLLNPQPVVHQVLEITGLLEHFGLAGPRWGQATRSADAGAAMNPAEAHPAG